MTILYELLGNVLTAIEPRNERARTWLDKALLRAHTNAHARTNPIVGRASLSVLRNDFQFFRVTQGADSRQQPLYDQVEHLLEQLESALALPYDDPRGARRKAERSLTDARFQGLAELAN
jgi:hypothetical protein